MTYELSISDFFEKYHRYIGAIILIVLACIVLYAVIDFHRNPNNPNLFVVAYKEYPITIDVLTAFTFLMGCYMLA